MKGCYAFRPRLQRAAIRGDSRRTNTTYGPTGGVAVFWRRGRDTRCCGILAQESRLEPARELYTLERPESGHAFGSPGDDWTLHFERPTPEGDLFQQQLVLELEQHFIRIVQPGGG
jgi:hypothetical protein